MSEGQTFKRDDAVRTLRAQQATVTAYAVGVLFPCGSGLVPWQTTLSLVKTVHALARMGVPVNLHAVTHSSLVTVARNQLCDNFLAGSEQYAFWIDADVVWEPEDFVRVMRLTKDLGVVCGAYPIKRDPPEMFLNFVEPDPQPHPKHGCIEIYGTGLGFTCVRRDILAELHATKPKVYHPGNRKMMTDVFRLDTTTIDGVAQSRGEDMAFFADIRDAGHKIWLDPTIELGHVGMKEYRVPLQELPKNDDV